MLHLISTKNSSALVGKLEGWQEIERIYTFHRPSLARIIRSVSEIISAAFISGSDRKWDLRFLSPKARETASCPLTLATSPSERIKKNKSSVHKAWPIDQCGTSHYIHQKWLMCVQKPSSRTHGDNWDNKAIRNRSQHSSCLLTAQ